MGDKKMMKKEKNPSPKKAAAGRRRYFKKEFERPSFPITVGERDWRRQDIIHVNKSGSGVVTKSWVVPSSSSCNLNQPPRKHSWPQLALIDIPPEIQATNDTGKYSLKGFFHQRQVTLHCSERYLLWGPDYYNLPRDSSVHFRTESSGSFQFVITGLTSLAFPFPKGVEQYNAGKFSYYWRYVSIMKSCTVIEPFSTTHHQYMELTNFIGLGGEKYYAISQQGSLAVIEYSEGLGDYEITRLGKNRAVPSKACRHFREHLFKYKGGIFLVFLLSRASVNVVDDVEVFGLDESSLCWKEVEKLPDDTVFFVEDKWCLGVSASLFGCKRGENCVYFSYERADTWFCFDMKTSCISVTEGPVDDLLASD
ncbi:recombination protein RecR [Striga asiatica]|uniref:Recombination protein RecR n=1 Tax=Striga asiatica TaxID=4170 RepID=A0A5A7RKQ9_STRAF|nr:recombination protein RecR [Striga asiatica]